MAEETVTDEIVEDEIVEDEIVEEMVISKDDYKKLRATGSMSAGGWKFSVAKYIMDNQGCTDLEAYDGSGGNPLNSKLEPISDKGKKNNIASAYTHLRDAGYDIKKENNKIYCLTKPKGKDAFIVLPDQIARYKRLIG